MERIEFEILSFNGSVLKHQQEGFLELCDNHLKYRVQYYCDIEHDVKGWQRDLFRDYSECVSKEKVCGIYISYNESDDEPSWKVNVSVTGGVEDTYVYFDDEKPARDMYNKIYNWLYK